MRDKVGPTLLATLVLGGVLGCVGAVVVAVVKPARGELSATPAPPPSPGIVKIARTGGFGIPGTAVRARVVDHVDGDTLRLAGQGPARRLLAEQETTVRLLEIDTPESVDPGSTEQCYAEPASRALARMLPLGADVWVRPSRQLLDPYGRTLLYVWTSEGRFVNVDMVRQGYARAVLYEPNDEFAGLMRRAESRARSAGRGLWGACGYFGEPAGSQ